MNQRQLFFTYCERGDVAATEMLLNDQSLATATNNDIDHETPLHTAAFFGHVDLADFLLCLGVKKEARNKDLLTPLHLAACYSSLQMVQLLVTKGAFVNALDKNGETPLHFAARHGRSDIARFLVENGADKDLRNLSGWTASDFSLHNVEKDLEALLATPDNSGKENAKTKKAKDSGASSDRNCALKPSNKIARYR